MIRKYEFSKFINAYFLNGFVNSFNSGAGKVWQPFREYDVGDVVSHTYTDNFEQITHRYICMSGLKSGNNPPVHTTKGEIKSDGGIRWLYVDTIPNLDNGMNNLYVTFGRPQQWNSGDYPPEAEIIPQTNPQSIADIIYAKRVDKNYISLVIDRNTWTADTVYEPYSADKNEYQTPHYVTNSQGRVYYCLSNNDGAPSTVEPVGESDEPINTLDGYTWLYAARVNMATNKFITDKYIPISREIAFNPYLNNHRGGIAAINLTGEQVGTFDPSADVQVDLINKGEGTGASFNVIRNSSGVIETIDITAAGEKYSTNTIALVKDVNAQGSGATATANVNINGQIDDITVTNAGANYNNAMVIIQGDGTGAKATATVSSTGVISNITIVDSGANYTYANVYIVAGTSGKLCSISILPYNTNKIDLMSSFDNISVMFLVEINPSEQYFPYDTYYREVMLTVNMYEKDSPETASKHEYIGKAHADYNNASSPLNKLDGSNGFVLYRQNTEKLLHVASQSELIKLVVTLARCS